MIFRDILDAVERLEAVQGRNDYLLELVNENQKCILQRLEVLREEQQKIKAALEAMDAPFPLSDAKMQEGIANLMAFDGRTRREEG